MVQSQVTLLWRHVINVPGVFDTLKTCRHRNCYPKSIEFEPSPQFKSAVPITPYRIAGNIKTAIAPHPRPTAEHPRDHQGALSPASGVYVHQRETAACAAR